MSIAAKETLSVEMGTNREKTGMAPAMARINRECSRYMCRYTGICRGQPVSGQARLWLALLIFLLGPLQFISFVRLLSSLFSELLR